MVAQKPFFIFAAKLLGSYAAWKIMYYLLETYNVPQWLIVKDHIAIWTNMIAAWMDIHLMNTPVLYNDRNIIPNGAQGMYLADHCLAIPAMVIFTLFIITYQGDLRHKLWFIPLGLFGILWINSLRVAALAFLQQRYSPLFFTFFHSYVYLVMAYGLIFLLIVWWVEVFAETKKSGSHA